MLLYQMAVLLIEEHRQSTVDQVSVSQRNRKALQLVYLLLQHPLTYPPFKDSAKLLRDRIKSELAADIVTAVKQQAGGVTLNTIVSHISQKVRKPVQRILPHRVCQFMFYAVMQHNFKPVGTILISRVQHLGKAHSAIWRDN